MFNKNYNKNNCCFRICKNILYSHGDHNGYLIKNELKQLNKILKENNFEVWRKIIQVWNKNNPNNIIKIDLKFKDYE